MRHLGVSDDDDAAEMRKFLEWGNAYELEKLAEEVSEIER